MVGLYCIKLRLDAIILMIDKTQTIKTNRQEILVL